MTTKFKINTFYKIHATAIETLKEMDVELRVVESQSPYVLANYDTPDVVIHPMSKIIKGEFPNIRFFGPNCEFPNYPFNPLVGFPAPSEEVKESTSDHTEDENKVVLINTVGDRALIKYAESMNKELVIYGKVCDSLYYSGPAPFDTYLLYANAGTILLDNEYEVLKALYMKNIGQTIITGFDYTNCFNLRNQKRVIPDDRVKLLEERSWNFIFNKLLEGFK